MWVALAALLVLGALVVAQWAVEGRLPGIPAAENLGEVGAAYGAAGAIISGLAFIAVVTSMVSQRRQLLRQQEELTSQKAELAEQKALLGAQTEALTATSRAQRDAAASLQGQLDHMARRARLEDYDRRLERFVDAQAALDDEAMGAALDSGMSLADARARLTDRYSAALTNLLRELNRMAEDPVTAPQAVELRKELKTSLKREEALLYLALVPPWVGERYEPSELGRLWVAFGLHPFVPMEGTLAGRAKVFRKHFWPLRRP